MSSRRRYESPRQLQRQSDILRSAREMLSEVGYAGTTMRTLAQKAGVAPATLYNLYGSKDQLVMAAVSDLFDEMAARMAESTERGIETIISAGEIASHQICDTPEYAEAMTIAVVNVEAVHPLVDVLFRRSYQQNAGELAFAQANGQLQPGVDVDNLARRLAASGWGIILYWMKGLLPLRDLPAERQRTVLSLLIPVVSDAKRPELVARLAQL